MGDLPEVRLTIAGDCASKANSRRAVLIGGRPSFIKSDKARGWVASATRQFPGALVTPLWTFDIVVFMKMWYATRRPDLDESLCLDFLQGRIYENDRAVKEKHIFWGLDRENPRVEIVVRPLR